MSFKIGKRHRDELPRHSSPSGQPLDRWKNLKNGSVVLSEPKVRQKIGVEQTSSGYSVRGLERSVQPNTSSDGEKPIKKIFHRTFPQTNWREPFSKKAKAGWEAPLTQEAEIGLKQELADRFLEQGSIEGLEQGLAIFYKDKGCLSAKTEDPELYLSIAEFLLSSVKAGNQEKAAKACDMLLLTQCDHWSKARALLIKGQICEKSELFGKAIKCCESGLEMVAKEKPKTDSQSNLLKDLHVYLANGLLKRGRESDFDRAFEHYLSYMNMRRLSYDNPAEKALIKEIDQFFA